MGTGTLTKIHRTTIHTSTSTLVELDNSERPLLDTPVSHRMGVDDFAAPFLLSIYGSDIVGQALARNVNTKGVMPFNWNEVVVEPIEKSKTIWDTPNLQSLLTAPLGSPIELTREEAAEVVRLAFGHRPDLPTGKRFVEGVRELLGHSLIERLKDAEQK